MDIPYPLKAYIPIIIQFCFGSIFFRMIKYVFIDVYQRTKSNDVLFMLIGRVFHNYLITNRWLTVDGMKYARYKVYDRTQSNRCFPQFCRGLLTPLRSALCSRIKCSGYMAPPKMGHIEVSLPMSNFFYLSWCISYLKSYVHK